MQTRKLFACAAAGLLVTTGCGEKPAPAAGPASAPAPAISTPADPYQAEIQKFQQEREAKLKTDTGWLTVAGLFFLSQPTTTFGSNPLNDIVLPAGAPDKAGTFQLKGGKVFVKAEPDVTFVLD